MTNAHVPARNTRERVRESDRQGEYRLLTEGNSVRQIAYRKLLDDGTAVVFSEQPES